MPALRARILPIVAGPIDVGSAPLAPETLAQGVVA